jgi:hypothetical protein
MDALQVAARFAAFACFLNAETRQPRSPEAAGRFARENWEDFLPLVDQELARFLISGPPTRNTHSTGSANVAIKAPRGSIRVAV